MVMGQNVAHMARTGMKAIGIVVMLALLGAPAAVAQNRTSILPPPPSPARTCGACETDRDACYAWCDRQSTSAADRLHCTNTCKGDFQCVQGADCR